jgi:FkbM family methyltransferase
VVIRNFARIVDTPIGRLVFNVNDFYLGRSLLHYGEFSGLEQRLFSNLVKPGDFAIDAGANIGVHSVFFARQVTDAGVVLAFEPQEHVFQALCANVFLNSLINVKPYRIALGAKPGSIEVPYMDPRRLNNFGNCKLGGQGTMTPMATIDSFDLPRCDFLKIDVEGMELEVIKGAKRTIEKFHPIIYAEVSPDDLDGIGRLQAMLYEYTYLSMHRPPLFNDLNPNGVLWNVWGENVVSFNLLATMEPPPDDPYLVPLSDYLEIHEPAEVLPPTQEEAPILLEPADGRG